MFAIPARIPTIVPMVSSLLEGFFFFPTRSPPFYGLIITRYCVKVKCFGEIYAKKFDPRRGLFDGDPAGGGAALGHYAAPGARTDA